MKRLKITPGFAAVLCVFWLTDQKHALAPFLAAAALHETGHILTLRMSGATVQEVRLGFLDARIVSSPLGYRQEAFAALAGPAASIAGCLAARKAEPLFAAISLLLGTFNLLPIWPLDGGRALRAFLELHMPLAKAETISWSIGGLLCVFGLVGAFICAGKFQMEMFPVLFWSLVLFRLIWYAREERGFWNE